MNMKTLARIMAGIWALMFFGLAGAGGSSAPITAWFAIIFIAWGIVACWLVAKYETNNLTD